MLQMPPTVIELCNLIWNDPLSEAITREWLETAINDLNDWWEHKQAEMSRRPDVYKAHYWWRYQWALGILKGALEPVPF